MGLTIVWTEPAAEAFADRLDFIGEANPDAARRLRQRVDEALRRLAEFPAIGRWVPESGPGLYREILVRPLRLLYEDVGDRLVVTHVQRQEGAFGPDSFEPDGEA